VTVFHALSAIGSLTLDSYSITADPAPVAFSEGMISLDFDDGWVSTYLNGLPIIEAAGLKSTQYVVSSVLGSSADGYISVAQMLDMQTRGHDIESHTKTHPELPLLSQAQMQDEIAGSKSTLEALGVSPITAMAYPYGEWDAATDFVVKQSGYGAARTALASDGGYNAKNGNPFLLKTFSVEDSDTTLAQVKAIINNALATKTWAILVMHQISNSPGQFGTTPARLQQIVDYIKSVNARVVTVREGVSLMSH
jgi:peptidoglycan/xylan/chitin deacetylase (PgdA/CDA1 family)